MKGEILRRKIYYKCFNKKIWHFSISIGDDIVEFNPKCYKKAKVTIIGMRTPGKVTRSSRWEYDDWEVVKIPGTESLGDVIVKIAKGYVGEEFDYDLLERNCEHFANYCFDAKAESTQAQKAKMFGGAGATSTAFATSFALASSCVALATPEATLLGSTTLGSYAAYYGLIAVPTAPAWVPIFSYGTAAVVSIGACVKAVEWVRKNPEKIPNQGVLDCLEECIICMENRVNIRFIPCNHMSVCENCSRKLVRCPECRCNIEGKVVI